MSEYIDAQGKVMKFVTEKTIKLSDGKLYGSFRPFDYALKEGDYVKFKYKLTEGTGVWEGRSFNNIVEGSIEAVNMPKDITGDYSQGVSVLSAKLPLDKDTLIVRQSSLKSAIEYCAKKPELDTIEVLKIAEQFENWVFRDG